MIYESLRIQDKARDNILILDALNGNPLIENDHILVLTLDLLHLRCKY